MITCPWCGTSYLEFRSNCQNCGGPLPAPSDVPLPVVGQLPPAPPSAPRPIADSYLWRLLLGDGWAVAAGIFGLIGSIFFFVGFMLTVAIITAFVGLPFALLGLALLAAGVTILVRRYEAAKMTVGVLRHGQAAAGRIVSAEANYNVRVNGRNPWTITYSFQANGQDQQGSVTTLNPPGPALQPDHPAWVLFLPDAPQNSTLYPHP